MRQKNQGTRRPRWLPVLAALAAAGCIEAGPVLSDSMGLAPVQPLPSSSQLTWQTQELTAFLHFGINTFTDKEQGDGTDSPMSFNPGTTLDAGQWMAALKAAGFHQVMLTAKHHDGFC